MYQLHYTPQGNNTYGFYIARKINKGENGSEPLHCFHVHINEDDQVFLTPLSEDTEKVFNRFAKSYANAVKNAKEIQNPSTDVYPLKRVGNSFLLLDNSQKCYFFGFTTITDLEILHHHYENFLTAFAGKINAEVNSIFIEERVFDAVDRIVQGFEKKKIYAALIDYEESRIFWRIDKSCPLDSVKDILYFLEPEVAYFLTNSILFVPNAAQQDDTALYVKNILDSGYPYFGIELNQKTLLGGDLENFM